MGGSGWRLFSTSTFSGEIRTCAATECDFGFNIVALSTRDSNHLMIMINHDIPEKRIKKMKMVNKMKQIRLDSEKLITNFKKYIFSLL